MEGVVTRNVAGYSADDFKNNICFGEERMFCNDHSRFTYFQKDGISPDYEVFDDTEFEVVVMSALPGSGKDTFIQKHFNEWEMVSLDDIRIEMNIKPTDKSGNGKVIQAAKEKAKDLMRQHQSFVWNATNITRQMRQQLIDLFLDYGAKVKIIYLEAPYHVLIKQNAAREDVVPANIMEKMIAKMEIPSPSEAHSVEYYYT